MAMQQRKSESEPARSMLLVPDPEMSADEHDLIQDLLDSMDNPKSPSPIIFKSPVKEIVYAKSVDLLISIENESKNTERIPKWRPNAMRIPKLFLAAAKGAKNMILEQHWHQKWAELINIDRTVDENE